MKHDLDEDVRVSSKNDRPTQPDTWAKCIYIFVRDCLLFNTRSRVASV